MDTNTVSGGFAEQVNSFLRKHNIVLDEIRLSLHCSVCGNRWGIKTGNGGKSLTEANFVCLSCLNNSIGGVK